MFLLRRVDGLSMAPAYGHGDIVLAVGFLKKPRVGDVVIARHHRVEIMKRIDQFDGDKVYLLGDNPEESTDSRQFGWLPVESIVGVVVKARAKVAASDE